jgi:hypothetical protein
MRSAMLMVIIGGLLWWGTGSVRATSNLRMVADQEAASVFGATCFTNNGNSPWCAAVHNVQYDPCSITNEGCTKNNSVPLPQSSTTGVETKEYNCDITETSCWYDGLDTTGCGPG